MTLLLIIGLALAGAAVALAGRALVLSRQRMAASISGIERYGFTSPGVVGDEESRSAINDLASFVGEGIGRRIGVFRESELRQDLVSAGLYRISARQLFGYQVLCGIVFGAVWALADDHRWSEYRSDHFRCCRLGGAWPGRLRRPSCAARPRTGSRRSTTAFQS